MISDGERLKCWSMVPECQRQGIGGRLISRTRELAPDIEPFRLCELEVFRHGVLALVGAWGRFFDDEVRFLLRAV